MTESQPQIGLPADLFRGLCAAAATAGKSPAQAATEAIKAYIGQDQDVLSLREAADFLGCHQTTLAQAARRGEVRAMRVGRTLRFHRKSLLNGL